MSVRDMQGNRGIVNEQQPVMRGQDNDTVMLLRW